VTREAKDKKRIVRKGRGGRNRPFGKRMCGGGREYDILSWGGGWGRGVR